MIAEILECLETVVTEVVEPNAIAVDKEGRFPKESIDALAKAGLLGLISAKDHGGHGLGPAAAVKVIARLSQACGSTAMVTMMHYAGVAVVEKYGASDVRRALATGEKLTTLAFSEAGSRSHFWAPTSTATQDGDNVKLNAKKSWITSADYATEYVWSSKPVSAEAPSSIWLVPANAAGLESKGPFTGLGLRGNNSLPVSATDVVIPAANRLGDDGQGFEIMMGTVLPIFGLMNAAGSLGLMRGAVAQTIAHASGTRYQHLDSALAQLPTIRAYIARMQIKTDMVGLLLDDAAAAAEAGREDAMLRVLEAKASAGESALEVIETAMRVCGGAAFRADVGVERYMRDSKAAGVMAPTIDQLYDFIGRALCGLPLFE